MRHPCVPTVLRYLRTLLAGQTADRHWLECRLGEKGPHGLVREPYGSLSRMMRRLRRLAQRPHAVDWVYKVTYGERAP